MRQIAEAAYQPYVVRMGRRPAPMTADYDTIATTKTAWIAERCGRSIGLLVLSFADDHLLIDNLAVAPSEQGLGVGNQLLRLAEQRADAAGLAELRLYTNEAMAENLLYYPRRGFHETHRAVQDGYCRVFFAKHVALTASRTSPR